MTTKIIEGNIPLGIYEGLMTGYQLNIDGNKEVALENKEYQAKLDVGVRGINCPVIVSVKNNEEGEKIVELIFKNN